MSSGKQTVTFFLSLNREMTNTKTTRGESLKNLHSAITRQVVILNGRTTWLIVIREYTFATSAIIRPTKGELTATPEEESCLACR